MAEPARCARDSDWCDGAMCREHGIACPNADCPKCGGKMTTRDYERGTYVFCEQPASRCGWFSWEAKP